MELVNKYMRDDHLYKRWRSLHTFKKSPFRLTEPGIKNPPGIWAIAFLCSESNIKGSRRNDHIEIWNNKNLPNYKLWRVMHCYIFFSAKFPIYIVILRNQQLAIDSRATVDSSSVSFLSLPSFVWEFYIIYLNIKPQATPLIHCSISRRRQKILFNVSAFFYLQKTYFFEPC